ncbi:MAG: hypothetical protein K1X53_13645, partial [Candidatus Sumerlaeaceae bacterium]|nr:hypothetical protein [Candidatus Sumerlaeaceae bacterium]
MSEQDTIVAPATPPGEGAIAIVRLSGPKALEILEGVFTPRGPETSELKDRRVTLGRVEAPSGELLDEALAVAMHAPHSFTGEHVAELHLNGSRAVVAAALDA